MLTANKLAKIYQEWIKQEVVFNNIESNVVRIDTPFFDRHNDSIIIYAVNNLDNSITLTDGAYTIDDLEVDGVNLMRSPAKLRILSEQLNLYGVKLATDDMSLFVKTNLEDFPSAKHRLVQAMLFTNDMFLSSYKHSKNFFLEDVAQFLEENDIRAMRNAQFTGSTGMIHKYEFSISGIRDIPDKLIKVLNSPTNDIYAKALTTDVKYTNDVVTRPTTFYAIVNDSEKKIRPSIKSLLEEENIKVINFSEKSEYIPELSM